MTRLAQGREAEVFLRPDGTVLKLWRPTMPADRADREAAALTALAGQGVGVPRLLGRADLDGRRGLVVERVDGIDFLTTIGRQPWRMWRVARIMADLHVAIHAVPAPASLPPLRSVLAARIDAAGDVLERSLADFARTTLAQLPDGDRLCHGDFHPGNILGPWSAPVVIDWGEATRGDPVADVARTRLLNTMGAAPPGTSALLQAIIPPGRRLFNRRYAAAYRRQHPVDERALRDWTVVRAAARFAEGTAEEYEALTRLLTRLRTHRRAQG
jgi:aminoglycoside phosphotransferase (APT) family kinase protein